MPHNDILHVSGSGMVTRCRRAVASAVAGRTSVVVVQNRDELSQARALLTLFSPDMSHAPPPPQRPVWDAPVLTLPSALHTFRTGHEAAQDSWPERLAVLYALRTPRPRCIVTTPDNLLIQLIPLIFFDVHELCLVKGTEWSPDLILEQAVEWGYTRCPTVTRRGEMARRGDILDIFATGYERPVRMEFFGDTLEDMRVFDVATQRSLGELHEMTLLPLLPTASGAFDAPTVLEEWLPKDTLWTQDTQDMPERTLHSFSDIFPQPGSQDRPWQHLVQGLKQWQGTRRQTVLAFATERGRTKFLGLAEQEGLLPALRYDPQQKGLFALIAPVRAGADMAWDNVLVLGEDILQPRAEKAVRVASGAFKGLDRFDDLNPGDVLVHRDYGIGRFVGLHRLTVGDVANDFLLLHYSGQDKLYVPADRLSLVQRFKAGDNATPLLDKLGGSGWISGKEKVRKAIEKIAADLVEMYAYRKVAKGFRYDPPGELYREFEATFGFDETPDQARAIQDVLEDMDKPEPMDRLVCGDVGFGKTEVALRAAFRAATEGRQVALLCPTTILAEQHYQTFRTRLSGFPLNVGLLSRFVSGPKQQETLKAASAAQIDILIGTHRLLSADVRLPNLGLLILDEEQRFGVRHKEKMKALKKNVDVLTLTATPIPRTLQLSMSGIRDLSIIETAPPERKPVATALLPRDPAVLKEIVEREIARQGQVFWVHNRVQGLERVVEYVRGLAPLARVGMAHGQLPEKSLEETMRGFWHGEIDVLVCTSIVESGLDFPQANTLIVDQAHMFGLGQLYQLRGRVGRSDRQAYAIFVTPHEERLTDTARERLRIILELDYLGAGFQVAMEDLRLRGAGNILGEVQTGHMARVGLDLFLEMLEDAVARLKGAPSAVVTETELHLCVPAHIPETYMSDGNERLRCYKALTAAPDPAAREDVALGIRDRFGTLPPELDNFLAVLDMKQTLSALQTQRADVYTDRVRLVWGATPQAVDTERLVALVKATPGARLAPPATLEWPLAGEGTFAQRVTKATQTLRALAR